jgi:hypothetical protein
MARLGKAAGVAFLLISGPAWAGESLINGQALQYNYAYRCKGERVIVARCRDDDDQSNCQIVYPDRPYQNGMQVAPVEMRGDIVAKLDACARPKATSVASTEPTRSNAKAPSTAATPSLGNATWSMLDMDDESATYFTSARIKRAGSSGSGWFTAVYSEPRDLSNDLKGVEYNQARYEANCVKRLLKMTDVAVYDENGKELAAGPLPNPTWDRVEPDSIGAYKLNILCGRPQPLAEKKPVTGDYETLLRHYLTSALEAAHEEQMKASQKRH